MLSRHKKGFKKATRPDNRLGSLALQYVRTTGEPASTLLELDQAFATGYGAAAREVTCARAMNFELPEDITIAAELLEAAVARITGTDKNVILVFDENTGIYTCLNDDQRLGGDCRELTRISDGFLQELIGSDNVIHTHLLRGSTLVGLVAVADRTGGAGFTLEDELTLEVLAPYLTTQVLRYQSLKKSLVLPFRQQAANDLASRLLAAPDQDGIVSAVFNLMHDQLGFEVCQYVTFNEETGCGTLLYEQIEGGLISYTHAGLESRRKIVEGYTGIVSLLASGVRQDICLYLPGGALGDKSLSGIFGVKNVQSALIMPVMDLQTGQIKATMNLFRTTPARISEDARVIADESAVLISQALARASVLEKALAMATVDELTGLLNRRGLYERFEAEIERTRRHGGNLCVALIDVDHFKKLNDTCGHLNGDKVLTRLGELFDKSVRKSDVVCRFGGEEFAILIPDTGIRAATDLIERVRRSVEKNPVIGIDGETMPVTISAGVMPVSIAGKSDKRTAPEIISHALSQADERLYHAKKSGRNQVCNQL